VSILNSVATLWIVVLMLVINVDVVGRTAFNSPLPGVPELVSLSIVAIVFLQIGHTLRAGRITRVDHMMQAVHRRWPKVNIGILSLYHLAGIAFFLVLIWAAWPLFIRSWVQGDYVGVEGYVAYPVWPVRLVLLIGSACAAIQYALFVWNDWMMLLGRRPMQTEESRDALSAEAIR
jgi:TRAP-type mannitol/chloroaromatic compound transport system permease small subunit